MDEAASARAADDNLPEGAAAVLAAIETRRSVRGFLPKPVPRATVERILTAAARAPSGTNMQPWKVYVLAGSRRDALVRAVTAAFDDPDGKHERWYKYYPDVFPEPYLSRRRKVGWDLYGLVGIGRGDKEKMHAQHGRNYDFFGAPVGMICTIDRRLELGSWLDYGMFLENIAIAARGFGLDTCPQAAWASYHEVVREVLGLPEEEVAICGLALGWEDPDEPANRLVTERAGLDDFTRFDWD